MPPWCPPRLRGPAPAAAPRGRGAAGASGDTRGVVSRHPRAPGPGAACEDPAVPYAVWVAAVVTAGLFAADWWAVWHDRTEVERLAKPAAMLGLLACALLAGAGGSASGRWLV